MPETQRRQEAEIAAEAKQFEAQPKNDVAYKKTCRIIIRGVKKHSQQARVYSRTYSANRR